MDVWVIIAAGAAVFSSINILPQLLKSFRTKKTKDLSYAMLGVIASGNVLWIAHGVHQADWALVISNIILLASTGVLAGLKLKYDKRR